MSLLSRLFKTQPDRREVLRPLWHRVVELTRGVRHRGRRCRGVRRADQAFGAGFFGCFGFFGSLRWRSRLPMAPSFEKCAVYAFPARSRGGARTR
jgi:hypothetical protein